MRAPQAWLMLILAVVMVGPVLVVDANQAWYAFFFDNDPQDPSQWWDAYLVTGAELYTSAFLLGQLVGTALGAWMVATDPRSDRPLRASRLLKAAMLGLLLGILDAVPAGEVATLQLAGHWALRDLAAAHASVDADLLHRSGVRWAIGAGLAGFTLWPVIGMAAAAALTGVARRFARGRPRPVRPWLVVTGSVVPAVPVLAVLSGDPTVGQIARAHDPWIALGVIGLTLVGALIVLAIAARLGVARGEPAREPAP